MRYRAETIPGKKRGAGLGFPTLNLVIPDRLNTEYGYGIYAGFVWIEDQQYPGAFHYGPIPVFDEEAPSLEVFVIDAKIEGMPREVFFKLTEKIRDVQNFKTPAELTKQMERDVATVREILKK